MLTSLSSEKCAFIQTGINPANTAVFSKPVELHIWKLTTLHANQIDYGLFSDAEMQRSTQIKNTKARQLHDSSRFLMRKLFASYLSVEPGQLAFEKNAAGKP